MNTSSPCTCSRSPQTLADVAPNAGVDHGDAPVLARFSEQFDLGAALRDPTVGIQLRSIAEEEFLMVLAL
jgi:hypothetical protein